jgi:hypothetical protein
MPGFWVAADDVPDAAIDDQREPFEQISWHGAAVFIFFIAVERDAESRRHLLLGPSFGSSKIFDPTAISLDVGSFAVERHNENLPVWARDGTSHVGLVKRAKLSLRWCHGIRDSDDRP